MIKIMNFLNENIIIFVLLSLSLSLSNCAPLSLPTTSAEAYSPPSLPFQDKIPLDFSDLERSYATLSSTAVTRDAIYTDVMSGKNAFMSTNNGQDFNAPIDESITNQPIGTYQYTDSSGDLHIVNYINDYSGLKILNDYKPYERTKTRKSFENTQNVELKKNGINKYNIDVSMLSYNAKDNSDDENIDWDEVEFRFIPEVKNDSQKRSYNQINNNNDSNLEERENNFETTSIRDPKFGQNNMTQIWIEAMNSIPLPQPFSGVPKAGNYPFFPQEPHENVNNWREPPIAQSIPYGIPLKASSVDLVQPFSDLFNWNYGNINRQ